jgi:hypothetical protein
MLDKQAVPRDRLAGLRFCPFSHSTSDTWKLYTPLKSRAVSAGHIAACIKRSSHRCYWLACYPASVVPHWIRCPSLSTRESRSTIIAQYWARAEGSWPRRRRGLDGSTSLCFALLPSDGELSTQHKLCRLSPNSVTLAVPKPRNVLSVLNVRVCPV